METQPTEATWMTVQEMQRTLKIGKNTALSLLASGAIDGIRVGRAVRVSSQSLQKYISEDECCFIDIDACLDATWYVRHPYVEDQEGYRYGEHPVASADDPIPILTDFGISSYCFGHEYASESRFIAGSLGHKWVGTAEH